MQSVVAATAHIIGALARALKMAILLHPHPHRDFTYCSRCGLDALRVDLRTEIRLWNGWFCHYCNNEICWMQPENMAIVFCYNAPLVSTRSPNRTERYLDYCILCHETVGSIHDRLDYRWYICNSCAASLWWNIWDWLTGPEANLPHEAACCVYDFIDFPD